MQQLNPQSHWAVTQAWFHLSHRLVFWISLGAVLALMGTFWLGSQYTLVQFRQAASADPTDLINTLSDNKDKITELRLHSESQLENLNRQMGRVQAHITRMNVLGEKMRLMLQADPHEFDFYQEPAMHTSSSTVDHEPLVHQLHHYESLLQHRIIQLQTLHHRAQRQKALTEVKLEGSGDPVKSGGKISSFYGKRHDPLHGHTAWHAGVDIAANPGSQIKALAGGMVKFAGKKGGYGHLVEIDHGDGLTTRYGHNKKLLVTKGQVIHKGEIIALLGSTGRSTGPHVHLEVHKNGQPVDPGHYFSDLRRS